MRLHSWAAGLPALTARLPHRCSYSALLCNEPARAPAMTGSLFKGNFWVSPRGGRQIFGLGTRQGRRPVRGRATIKRTGAPDPHHSGTVRGAAPLGRPGTRLALETLVPLLRVRTRANTRPQVPLCRGP